MIRFIPSQPVRYGLVSALTFGVDIVTFNVLMMVGFGLIWSHLGSVLVAVFFSYLVLSKVVFSHAYYFGPSIRVSSFLIVNLLAILASSMFVTAGQAIVGSDAAWLEKNLIKFAAVSLTALGKFALYRWLTFRVGKLGFADSVPGSSQ